METKGSKRTKIILAVLIGLLVLVIAVVAFVLVRGKMKEGHYTAAIEEAEKYLAERDYEQAIVAYENAIAIDPDNDEAYLALADIYVEQGDITKARSILRQGYRANGSQKLKRRMNILEKTDLTAKTGGEKEEIDLATASQNIAWDTSFLQKMINYTFDDYKNEFGRVVSAEVDDDGYLAVRHEKLDAVCYYKNTSDNKKIVDNSQKVPYATGMPAKIVLDDLGSLFRNFDGGASLNRMQMLFGERVTPKTLEGRPYIENKEEDIVARIGTDKEGNIISPSSWNELILPLANKKKASEGTLEGVVVDAVTGKGVQGAELTFNPKNSSHKVVTESTDSFGSFRVELEPDDYKITVKAQGYIAEDFAFTIEKGRSYSGVQFVISPELSGEARIVLEWGAQPTDLDSYLDGTLDNGDSFRTYYGRKRALIDDVVVAELDLDDTDGYGPETTTIHNLDGVYTFTVVDFTGSGTMAQNGATVKIYLPGQEPVVVQLSASSGVDNVWSVCEIDHGKLEVLNKAGSGTRRVPGK